MEKVQTFDIHLFRVPKLALKALGFWPQTKLTPIRIFHGSVNLAILSWAVISEVAYGVKVMKNPIVALDAIAPSLSQGVTIIKLSIMWLFRNRFKAVITQTEDLLKSKDSMEKLNILKQMKKFAFFFGVLVFFFGNAANLSYFLRPIANGLIAYFHGGNATREMPFLALDPFEMENRFIYVFGYALNSYFGIIASFGFGGIDGFFVQFCLYMSALFQICQEDFKSAFYSGPELEVSREENESTQKKLATVIAEHNVIMDMSEEIVNLFTLIIMSHFLSAAIVICIAAVDCIMGSGFNIIVYTIHVLMAIFELFVYCIGGQGVYDSSIDIARAAYFEEWYKYDIKTQKMIILIMTRAQKGTSVEVPFFAPNIPVFATMLRTATSYMTLLKTFL